MLAPNRLVVVGLLFLSTPASAAWNWRCNDGTVVKWGSSSVTYNIPGPNSSSALATYDEVFSLFNKIGSKLSIYYRESTSLTKVRPTTNFEEAFGYLSSTSPGNGVNEIWWAYMDGGAAEAFFHVNCSTHTIVEADIIIALNAEKFPMTSSKAKVDSAAYNRYLQGDATGGKTRRFQNVLMHELGHTVGFAHEGDTFNIMGDQETHIHANGANVRLTWGEDFAFGLRALYGSNATAVEDVSLAHWYRTGEDAEELGGYSRHGRTTSTATRVDTADDLEPVYSMKRGTAYDVMVNRENNGKSSQTTTMKFYLSSNELITLGDTPLKGVSLTVTPNSPTTSSYSITIPASTTSGTYWLGAIVDEKNAISETDESNNATYLFKVKVN